MPGAAYLEMVLAAGELHLNAAKLWKIHKAAWVTDRVACATTLVELAHRACE